MGLQAYYSIEIVGKLNMMARRFAIDHALSPKIYKNQRKNKKVKNTFSKIAVSSHRTSNNFFSGMYAQALRFHILN